MAELIVSGAAAIDLAPFDPARLAPLKASGVRL